MEVMDPFLRTAIQEIQNGEYKKALEILLGLIRDNPDNPEAWFWLSMVSEEPRQAAFCLHKTLMIAANHPGALQQMAQLEQTLHLSPLNVMRIGASSASFKSNCPYCRSEFQLYQEMVVCPQCQRSHHYACWVDNWHACAGTLCSGFSLKELKQDILPIQPAKLPDRVIVIHKEDIKPMPVPSRKQKEDAFLLRLLGLTRGIESGAVPPMVGLPTSDQILDQLQRDQKEQEPDPVVADPIPQLTDELQNASVEQAPHRPKYCLHCGKPYPRPQSGYCAYCGKERSAS